MRSLGTFSCLDFHKEQQLHQTPVQEHDDRVQRRVFALVHRVARLLLLPCGLLFFHRGGGGPARYARFPYTSSTTAIIASTTCSGVMFVESTSTASSACRSGSVSRFMSCASRAFSLGEHLLRKASCRPSRSAGDSAAAGAFLRRGRQKDLHRASISTRVPMSRPSISIPPSRRFRAARPPTIRRRTAGHLEMALAAAETSPVRISGSLHLSRPASSAAHRPDTQRAHPPRRGARKPSAHPAGRSRFGACTARRCDTSRPCPDAEYEAFAPPDRRSRISPAPTGPSMAMFIGISLSSGRMAACSAVFFSIIRYKPASVQVPARIWARFSTFIHISTISNLHAPLFARNRRFFRPLYPIQMMCYNGFA